LTEKERDSRLAVDGIRWSSDSRHIAFIWGASVRDVSAKWDLCIIDPDGTNRRVIYSDDTNSLALYGWLPDGKSLLISTKKGDQPQQLFRISVDNGSMQLIRSLPETQILAYRSSLSSDGRYLAYTTDPYSKRDLFVLPVSGGAPVKINDQAGDITIIGWTPDSRSFLFTSDMGVSTSLWRIDLSQGKPLDHPVLVQENIGRVSPLGITANGSIFYYSEKTYIDVYTVGIDLTSGKIIGAVEQVNTTHLGMSRTPAWSHDGESLAYMAASSADEPANTTLCVWSAKDRKHTEFRLRMPITIGASGHLSWSPNGRYIFGATFNRATRAYELARIDSQTGEVSIVAALQNATIIGWARDGAFTLAIRRDNGAPLIVKRDSLSGDEKECFRKPVGNYTWRGDILSPDGNWMLVGHGEPRSNVRQLLLVPTGAGEPRELASANAGLRFGFWSPDSHSLFCFQSAGQGIYDLWKASLDGGMPAKVSQISIPGMNTFSISLHPDGKRIAFESSTHKTEYWVMENLPLSGDQKREEH
jgi:Tol biopolymer transport system component